MSLRLHRSVELVPLRGGVESQVYLLVENRAEYGLRINRSESWIQEGCIRFASL